MKKILIVSNSLTTGGIGTSLVNMANELSRYYQVDLFLYDPTGTAKSRLKDTVRILPASWRFTTLGIPFRRAIGSGKPAVIWFRLWTTVWCKLFSNQFPIQVAIRHQEKMSGYDLAFAYHHEGRRHAAANGFARVVEHCVDAKQKAAWIHFDCELLDLDSQYHQQFYRNLDKIICVSQSLQKRFQKKYPLLRDKVDYCYNFLDYEALYRTSLEPQPIPYPAGKRICFSACRLSSEKALVRGIRCLAPVFQKHRELMWYIAGEGPEREAIEQEIQLHGLGDQVILLGNLSNPYPYMRNADLLMNISYHEAAPMVFLEANALGVPVFATETSSARELLEGSPCSRICENSEQGIYEAFLDWAEQPPNNEKHSKAVSTEHTNKQSLMKIQQWLDRS